MSEQTKIDDGGPAFPVSQEYNTAGEPTCAGWGGMALRDYFAAQCQADDRLVKCIRAMDDKALEYFALYPDSEREEHITEVQYTNWDALPSEVAKVTRRLEIESKAIARVRYMQADAMLAARNNAMKQEPQIGGNGDTENDYKVFDGFK